MTVKVEFVGQPSKRVFHYIVTEGDQVLFASYGLVADGGERERWGSEDGKEVSWKVDTYNLSIIVPLEVSDDPLRETIAGLGQTFEHKANGATSLEDRIAEQILQHWGDDFKWHAKQEETYIPAK